MIYTIFIGSIIIAITILVELIIIDIVQSCLQRWGNIILGSGTLNRKTAILVLVTFLLLAALSVAIWIWAIGFMVIGAFDDLETSLYFSMVSFTTLGFGDVLLPQHWRLLSGIIAANGLLLVGLNTAVLIDVMARMRDGDMRTYLPEKKANKNPGKKSRGA